VSRFSTTQEARRDAGAGFSDRAAMAQIQRWLRNFFVNGQRLTLSPESARVNLPVGDGVGVTLAKIVSGSGAAHVCDMYADGLAETATETGVAVTTDYVAAGESLPVGAAVATMTIGAVRHALPGGVWL